MKLGAIVAGATGGIGKAVATNLSKKYKYILLLGRDEYKLTSLVEDLSERFPDNKYFDATADITYLKDVEYVVSDFAKICDRVDLMVNAAGILFTGTSDITYDKLIKLIEVNFIGVYNLTQSVLPQMKKNNKGKIIHILSMSATRSMPGVGGYSASKSAAASYLDSLIKDTIEIGRAHV